MKWSALAFVFTLTACGVEENEVRVERLEGEQGERGVPGMNGRDGRDGRDGRSTTIRETGNGIIFTDGEGKQVYWRYPEEDSNVVTLCLCNSDGSQFEDTGDAEVLYRRYYYWPERSKRVGHCVRNRTRRVRID